MWYKSPIWDEEARAVVAASWGQVPAYEIAAQINVLLEAKAPRMPFCPTCRTAFVGQRQDGRWRCRNCSALFPTPVIGGGQIATSRTGSGVVFCAQLLGLIDSRALAAERQRALRAWYRFCGSEPVSTALRQQILARDSHRCLRCGSTEELEVDHIFPRVHGGPSVPENLQTLCATCNVRKSSSVDAGHRGGLV